MSRFLVAPAGRHVISYFPLAGRSQIGKVALFNGGFDFVVESIAGKDFGNLKIGVGYGSKIPLGSLPTLTKPDGSVITQSTAIARYAGKFGKEPLYDIREPEELVYVDEILESVEELISRLPQDANPEKKKELREVYAKDTLPKYLTLFEKRVAARGGPFLLGSKLSVADVGLHGLVNSLRLGNFDHLPKEYIESFPSLIKLYEAVSNHPTIIAFGKFKNLLEPPQGKYKLCYFPGVGRGFAAKVALHNAKFDWEEVFINGKQLAQLKGSNGFSDDCPLGQLPILITPDGIRITQSSAIARFAGRYGRQALYPSDPEQALIVDELISLLQDIKVPMNPDDAKKKELRELWMRTDAIKFYSYIEKRIQKSNGPFILGKDISVADLVLFSHVNAFKFGFWDHIPKNFFDSFPSIATLADAVKTHPIVISSKQLEDNRYAPSGKFKLTYFPVLGRGFAPKVALFNGGFDYEDDVVAGAAFKDLKPSLPLGALPVLTKPDGTKITQSSAIARYAARYGKDPLYPIDPVKALFVDELIDITHDINSKAPQDPDAEKKKAKREAWGESDLPKFLTLLNTRITENGGPFALGDKISLADLAIYSIMDMIKTGNLDYIPSDYADKYTELITTYDAVRTHPMVVASKQLDIGKA